MNSRDFCYWLQGYFELNRSGATLDVGQVEMIKSHLNMVFKHEIDPSHGSPSHQKELSELHHGGKDKGGLIARC